jgi:hypothetical protein
MSGIHVDSRKMPAAISSTVVSIDQSSACRRKSSP